MGQRRHNTQNSMELLLDTICNTFGGLLFIAMLVAVMVQATSDRSQTQDNERVTSEDLYRLAREQEITLSELESVRLAAAQQDTIMTQFATPDNLDVLRELLRLRGLAVEKTSQRLKLLGNITRAEASTAAIGEELVQLDKDLADASKEVIAARDSLAAEVAARKIEGTLPRLHDTRKHPVPVVIRYGRMYVWHRYSRSGARLGLNTDDFVAIEQERRYLVTTPKPYAGTPVTDAARLRRRLSEFDAARNYLDVIVWQDSFDSFQEFKNTLIDLGFEYGLEPACPGDSWIDRGGTGRGVQ